MKTKKMIPMAVAMLLTLGSCNKEVFGVDGKGPVQTETRYESGFTAVELEIDAEVILIQDSIYSIEVSAQENVLDVLETKVNDQKLKIEYDRQVWDHKPVKIIIHMPQVKGLELSGSGSIRASGNLNGSYLQTEITGSGFIELNEIHYAELYSEITGSGDLTIHSGSADHSELEITGSGNLFLQKLPVNHCKVEITGSGNAELQVTQSLYVNITGSGSVYYLGTPQIDVSITGSGDLKHI